MAERPPRGRKIQICIQEYQDPLRLLSVPYPLDPIGKYCQNEHSGITRVRLVLILEENATEVSLDVQSEETIALKDL